MYENWAISLTVKKQSWLTDELNNLTTKQRKNSLVCGFDVAFLSNVFRVFEKLWSVFNAGKKLFNPAQVALTKITRNGAKIYQKTYFLSSEGYLLTYPGCCLTLPSSLDIVQVRFASWSVYCVLLLGNDLSTLSRFSSFAEVQCLYFLSSKVRCGRFLARLLGSLFYFVVLKNFKIYFFNWYFVMPWWSAPAYFNSLKLKFKFLPSRLLCISMFT